jgi:aspartyl-tRNA(Asn)/glutamyl-tRNA(Gln) amidotransferase subunit C
MWADVAICCIYKAKKRGDKAALSAEYRGIETLTDGRRLRPRMTDSPVDTSDVEHVAGLARVDLDPADVEAFAEQFREILDYFEALEDVPEVEAEPELVNVMRADEVRDSLSQDAALDNAESSEDGRFKGPRVS